ncbi:MAG: hypothetical protein ABSF25_21775 [Bryobacteraceae bacterium]
MYTLAFLACAVFVAVSIGRFLQQWSEQQTQSHDRLQHISDQVDRIVALLREISLQQEPEKRLNEPTQEPVGIEWDAEHQRYRD